jgi:hypothetical protein
MEKNKDKRYVQLIIAEEQISNAILAGYYKSHFATDICKLIRKETKRYTENM